MAGDNPYGQLPPPPMVTLTPPDAMSQQLSQAVQPVGGTPEMPAPDFFSGAQAVMEQSPDYQRGSQLADTLTKKALSFQKASNAYLDHRQQSDPDAEPSALAQITQQLMQTNSALQNLRPAGFSFMPGANHRNEVNYATQQASLKTRQELLRGLAEIYQQQGKTGVELLGQMHNRYGDLVNTAEAMRKASQGEETNTRLTQKQQELDTYRQALLRMQQQGIDIRQFLAPYQAADLQAGAGLRGSQAATNQAALPYVAPTKGAQLRLTNAQAGAVAPRTAAGMAAATGVMPNQNMMQSAGMLPPGSAPPNAPSLWNDDGTIASPPEGVPTVVPPGALPTTPKFQQTQAVNRATISNKNAGTAHTQAATTALNQKTRGKIEAKAQFAGMPLDDYLKAHPDDAAVYHGQSDTNRGGTRGSPAPNVHQAISDLTAQLGRKPTLAELKKHLGQ